MAAAEARVEKYLHTRVTQLGGTTRKWTSPGRDGVPDRICILPGNIVFFVEVKTEGGKLTMRQTREHGELKRFNCEVYTVYGSNGVDQLIQILRDRHGIA